MAKRLRIETLLNRAAEAIYAVDESGTILFWNRALELITGVSSESARTLSCTEAGPDAASLESSLSPPNSVFEGHSLHIPRLIPKTEGEPDWHSVHFVPLLDESSGRKLVLGFVTEQGTELRQDSVEWLQAELISERQAHYQRFRASTWLGSSASIQRAFVQVRLAAHGEAAVMIDGPAGAGKEYAARAIHAESSRAQSGFVTVDCAMLPSQMLERELFGSEMESMATSEAGWCEGEFEGTLYVKHVSQMPVSLQVRMALSIQRQSDPSCDQSKCVILLSDRTPAQELRESEALSPELYFSATSVVVHMPPLKDRLDDLPLLTQHFINETRGDQKLVTGISNDALELLMRYDWPQNIRELRTVVEEAIQVCTDSMIQPEHIAARVRLFDPVVREETNHQIDLEAVLGSAERRLITRALEKADGNKSMAAELLSITRARLYRRMELLEMVEPAERREAGSP